MKTFRPMRSRRGHRRALRCRGAAGPPPGGAGGAATVGAAIAAKRYRTRPPAGGHARSPPPPAAPVRRSVRLSWSFVERAPGGGGDGAGPEHTDHVRPVVLHHDDGG